MQKNVHKNVYKNSISFEKNRCQHTAKANFTSETKAPTDKSSTGFENRDALQLTLADYVNTMGIWDTLGQ